ncbi:hypothetical protein MCELHM10_03483 [Paracoccaceae bacterium]|jgi:hypothetical protein
MATNPFSKKPEDDRPKIWATGNQRPPFNLPAFGRASLFFAREGVAPLHAWVARTGRRVALNVRDGAGRIPEAKLGRVAPYVPSHLRVAMWIKNLAAVHAHASASADPDVRRGNALVAAIEPHLWEVDAAPVAPSPEPLSKPEPPAEPAPVVLAEPEVRPYDPLASIRADLRDPAPAAKTAAKPARVRPPAGPQVPPLPPGPIAGMAIQIIGYAIGWASAFVALPYGLIRSLWAHAKGQDLRKIGAED